MRRLFLRTSQACVYIDDLHARSATDRALGEYIPDDEAYARPSWLNFSKSPEPPAGLEGILAKVFKKAVNKSSTDSMFPDSGDDMLIDGH